MHVVEYFDRPIYHAVTHTLNVQRNTCIARCTGERNAEKSDVFDGLNKVKQALRETKMQHPSRHDIMYRSYCDDIHTYIRSILTKTEKDFSAIYQTYIKSDGFRSYREIQSRLSMLKRNVKNIDHADDEGDVSNYCLQSIQSQKTLSSKDLYRTTAQFREKAFAYHDSTICSLKRALVEMDDALQNKFGKVSRLEQAAFLVSLNDICVCFVSSALSP